jgi:hypothetical protein
MIDDKLSVPDSQLGARNISGGHSMKNILISGIRWLACLVCVVSAQAVAEIQTFSGQQAFEISRKQTCGTLDDGVTRYGVFEGRAYSRVPGEKDRHLFNVLGVNTRQCGTVTDPERGAGFRSVSREVMLYLDSETNQVLDRWENPWSGETVEVVHVANDPVNMREPRFALNDSGQPRTTALRRYGEMLFSSSEVPLFYDNPLGGDYQQYVGGTYHAMEIFNSSYHADELLGEVSLSRSYVAWTRVAQWLPWMQMGSRPGIMVINATGTSVFDRGVIPDPLMSVLEDRYPSYFEPPPVDDARPNETSWTVFRKFIDASTTE